MGRDKACFESKGSQLRTHHASRACTEFDLRIGRDCSRKSSLAGDIDHHARADASHNCFQRLLWPWDPSFGEAAVARRSAKRRPALLVQHTMRREPFRLLRRVTAPDCDAGRRSNLARGSGRTPVNPFDATRRRRTDPHHLSMHFVQTHGYVQSRTLSSARPLRAPDEHVQSPCPRVRPSWSSSKKE